MNKCSLCGKGYHGHGHDAQPLSNGKCCNECLKLVKETRLLYMYDQHQQEELMRIINTEEDGGIY